MDRRIFWNTQNHRKSAELVPRILDGISDKLPWVFQIIDPPYPPIRLDESS
jgi:hypothetical protein